MPIVLYNNYVGSKADPLTLARLVAIQRQGCSVMKTPHVGNQHPSNLLCASLGFHMDMVTNTIGERDQNFHPHLRIEGRVGTELFSPTLLTPLASAPCGTPAEEYHQSSVRRVFPRTTITTDAELLLSETGLAEKVMRRATSVVSQLWYRKVTGGGVVMKAASPLCFSAIADDVFRFSNPSSGWLVPNKINIIYTSVWQSLATGRNKVYALSGPDMVGYIGGLRDKLSAMYDAVRKEVLDLPEVLHIYVVPVAQCKLVSHRISVDAINAVVDVLKWYERQPTEVRSQAIVSVKEIGAQYPVFTQPIAQASFLCQYDLVDSDELYIPEWLIDTPLSRVEYFMSVLDKGREQAMKVA